MRLLLLCACLMSTICFAEEPAKTPEKKANPPETPPAKLIQKSAGQLPIIISCPHDGTLPIPGVPVRVGTGIEKFVIVRDTNAGLIAEELATELEKRFKRKPYLILAKFSRKYTDANRPADGAYEDPKAKPIYDEYHQFLKDSCQEVQKNFQRGLLLDIHGQGAEKDTVYRGTNNLKTVKALVDRFGKPAMVGEKSILGHMSRNGVKIFPPIDSNDPENKSFAGGYIVQTYGSHTAYAIDAIQLETGGNQRNKDRKDFVMKLADGIEVFAKEYLTLDAKPSDPASKK